MVSYTFLTHPAYVARINAEIGGEWMFWDSSHTGISLEQATKPKIITTLVPCTSYPFSKPKGHWLTLLYPCRGCSSQGSKHSTGEGMGAGRTRSGQGGHSWWACPNTDMRHRPGPSGSAFAAVQGLESTTYD